MTDKPNAAPAPEPVAWIEHHKAGDNLLWDEPGGKKTALYAHPAPVAAPAPDADAIMALAQDYKDEPWPDENHTYAALRAAVERAIAERDEAVALLKEARGMWVDDHSNLAARIDALLARSSARASTDTETTPPQVG